MKKILMTFILGLCVMVANAQISTQNSKFFDNFGIGITGGVSTPLDFNSVFPLNPNAGIKIQKNFTPEFALQAEGITLLNDNHLSDIKTAFKAMNIGVNSMFNLTNIFKGYSGSPRTFEMALVGGLGWMREFDTANDFLTSKTGLDFIFNLGKGHSIVASPAIYWNLNKLNDIQFNKKNSQLAVNISYMYFFKNSNGTHAFKTYDVGAMTDEIARLNEELAKKPKVIEKTVVNKVEVPVQNEWFVQFAKNSYELTDKAKDILNKISGNVKIVAYASPEGTAEYNKELSQKRADSIVTYLLKNGVNVVSYEGVGVIDDASNRIAVITCQ